MYWANYYDAVRAAMGTPAQRQAIANAREKDQTLGSERHPAGAFFVYGQARDRERDTGSRRSGDSYMRGMADVDPLAAYDAETRRGALQGLFGSQSGGGGAGGGNGFNITGPGGPVASLNYNTGINPQQQIGNPQAGAAQIQAPPANFAGNPGAASFNNNFAGLAQNAGTQFRRSASDNQNQYFNQAQGSQNQNALSGLSQGIRNQSGARSRQNTKMSIAGGFMGGAGR